MFSSSMTYATEDVKVERSNECEISICQACLSSDRVLTSLGDCEDVYQNISLNSYSIQSELYFCWECTAMLKKIKLFKEKLRQAQRILRYQNFNQQNRPKTCLSKLTTTKINTENIIILYEQEQDTDNKYNIKIKQEIDFENESLDDNYLEEIKVEEKLTHTLQNVEFDLNEKKERAKKYRMILNTTEGRASRKIRIGIEELDMWLIRERNSIFYQNLANKCDKCVTKLSRKQSLDEHNKSHHDETMGRYTCDICQTHFATKSSVASHVAGHYYVRHCNICGYECYTSGHMNNHMEGHKKTVQCLDCHACYNNVRQFYKHYKAMHCDYICDHCDKRCKSKHSLEKHMRAVTNMNDKNNESESDESSKKKLQEQVIEQQESPRAAGVKSEPESDINTSQRKKKSKRKRYVNGDEKLLHEDSNDDKNLASNADQEQASFTVPLSIKHKRIKYNTDPDANLDSTNNESDSSSIKKSKKSIKKKDKRDKYESYCNLDLGELKSEVLEIEWCKENEDNTELIKIEDTLREEETVAETPHTAPKHQVLTEYNRTDHKCTEIIEIDKLSAEQTDVETRQKVPKNKDLAKSNKNYLTVHTKQDQGSFTATPFKHKRKKHKRDSNSNLDVTSNDSESSCTRKSKKTPKINRDSDPDIEEVNTNVIEYANDFVENQLCKDSHDSTVVMKIEECFSAEDTIVGNRHEMPKHKDLAKSNDNYLTVHTKQEQASFTATPSKHKRKKRNRGSNANLDDTNNESESSCTKKSKKTPKINRDSDLDIDVNTHFFVENELCKDSDDSTVIMKSDDYFSAEETVVGNRHEVPKDLTKQEQASFTAPLSIKHKRNPNKLNSTNNESESSSTKEAKKSRKKHTKKDNLDESFRESKLNLGELKKDFLDIECCKDSDDSIEVKKIKINTPHTGPKHQDSTKYTTIDEEDSDKTEIIAIEDHFNTEQTAVKTRHKVSKHKDLTKSNAKLEQISFATPAAIKHKKHKRHSDANLNSTNNESESMSIEKNKKSRQKKKRDRNLDESFNYNKNKLGQLTNEFMQIGWCREDDSTEKIRIEDRFSAEDTVLESPQETPKHKESTKSNKTDKRNEDNYTEQAAVKTRHKFPKHDELAKSNDSYIVFQAKEDQASFTTSCKHKQNSKKHKSDPNANLDSTNDEHVSSNIKKSKKPRKKNKKKDNDLDESFPKSELNLSEIKKEFLEIEWCKNNDYSTEIMNIEDTLTAEETIEDTPHTGSIHQDFTNSTLIDSEDSDSIEIFTIEDTFSGEKTTVETRHKVSKHKGLIKSNAKQEQTSFPTPASIKHKKHKINSDANLNSTNNEPESTSIKKIKKSKKKKKRDRDLDESFNYNNIKLGQLTNEFMEIGWCREDDSTEKITIEDTFSAEDTVLETPNKTPKHKDLTKTDNESSDETEIITIDDMIAEKSAVKIRHKAVTHDGLTKSFRTDSGGSDQSKESESSQINPNDKYNNNDSHATDIQTDEITKTPNPSRDSKVLITRRVRLEDDTSYMNEIVDDSSYVISSRIRQYVKGHPHLRPCEPREDSPITDDDELWVINVPHDFDITHLKGTDILLDKDSEAKMKVDSQIYKGRLDDSIDRISLLTSDHSKFVIRSVPIMGTVQFHPKIPKVRYMYDNYMPSNSTECIPLPETKRRHPLFGCDYETAMEIPELVKARLKNAEVVQQSPCTEEKKQEHSEVAQLNAKPQLRSSGHHTKKKKNTKI